MSPATGATGKPIVLSMAFLNPTPPPDPTTCPHTTTTLRNGEWRCKRCGALR